MNPLEQLKTLISNSRHGIQAELSSRIGVPTSTINNWIKRGSEIPASKIIPICEFFNVSVHYFLTGTEEQLSESSSEPENLLLERFRVLDQDGQNIVNATLTLEWRRCTGAGEPQLVCPSKPTVTEKKLVSSDTPGTALNKAKNSASATSAGKQKKAE